MNPIKNLDSASNGSKNNFGTPPKIQYSTGNRAPAQLSLLKSQASKRSPIFKGVLVGVILVVFILGALLITRASNLTEKIFAGQTTTFFGKVWEAIRGVSGKVSLQGENKGQINVLLLGIGGEGHDGPFLTDTMILAQIRPETSEVAFVSIPRDLLAELPNNLGERKINAVFAEGVSRTQDYNEAGRWARMAVERLSGQTIPYFAVIDFEGFKKAIDEVEGVAVEVEKTFDDYSYPVPGKEDAENPAERYEHLHFDKGVQEMDGLRALKYARSRHGTNGEGSDFARSVRQQKVIKAFKDKVFNMNLISSAGTINNLLGIFAENFHTNLSPGEVFRAYDIVKEQNIQTFLSLSLDPETGLLCATSHETAGYILVPCQGKTSADIQNFFKNAFVLGKLREEKSVIWLGDSTQTASFYTEVEKRLQTANLTVWKLDYSQDNLPETIIYQVNPKPATAEFLKNVLNAKNVTLPPPGVKVDPAKVDVIVILGQK
jgi:polyisoprenyl-teichoic acid--peptidoglycan teichoic acid transferase